MVRLWWDIGVNLWKVLWWSCCQPRKRTFLMKCKKKKMLLVDGLREYRLWRTRKAYSRSELPEIVSQRQLRRSRSHLTWICLRHPLRVSSRQFPLRFLFNSSTEGPDQLRIRRAGSYVRKNGQVSQPLPKSPWTTLTGTGYTCQYPSSRKGTVKIGNIKANHVATHITVATFARGDREKLGARCRRFLDTRSSTPIAGIWAQKNAAIQSLISVTEILVFNGSGGTSPICITPEKKNADVVRK